VLLFGWPRIIAQPHEIIEADVEQISQGNQPINVGRSCRTDFQHIYRIDAGPKLSGQGGLTHPVTLA
jgi:hypothetical protein